MTKRQRVLQLLRDAGPRGVVTAAFLEGGCGSRFGARIQELRDDGFAIVARPVRPGQYRYVLVAEPEGEMTAVAAPLPAGEMAADRLFAPPPLNAVRHDWERVR